MNSSSAIQRARHETVKSPRRLHQNIYICAVLIVLCGVFLFFSCSHLREPGLEYDEVLFANAALGNLDNSFLRYVFHVGKWTVPIMLMPYIGALKAWLYTPIFKLAPVSAVTVRLPMILLSLLTLIATYFFTARVLNRKAAIIAVALLSTDPVHIFLSRLDWGPVVIQMLLRMASLYLFARFVKTRRLSLLAAASFCLGLGIYDKIIFSWYVLALPLAALLAWRKECLQFIHLRNVSAFSLAFLLGCWPLIMYNIARPGETFKGELESRRTLAQTLRAQSYLIIGTISGEAPYQYINGESLETTLEHYVPRFSTFIPHHALTLYALGLAVLWLIMTGSLTHNRTVLFIFSLLVLIALQIYITPHATGPHHVIMLYPLPHLIIAYALSRLPNTLAVQPGQFRRVAATYIVFGSVGLLVLSNLAVDSEYLLGFVRTGGSGVWSDAIYPLAEYVQQGQGDRYLLMDWGFNTQLLLLSRGKIKKTEIFWSLLDQKREDTLAQGLYTMQSTQPTLFVFHSTKYTAFSQPRIVFDLMVQRNHLRETIVKVFRQRNGDPVYVIERLEPTTQSQLSP